MNNAKTFLHVFEEPCLPVTTVETCCKKTQVIYTSRFYISVYVISSYPSTTILGGLLHQSVNLTRLSESGLQDYEIFSES